MLEVGKKIFLILGVIYITIAATNVYARRGCCSHHGGVSGACRSGMQVCNDGSLSSSCECESVSSSPAVVRGCTYYDSINYNPNANSDDGSCIQRIRGCTDANAYNYDSTANTDDGSCISKVYGCIDKKAINYNKDANSSDGSCKYKEKQVSYKKIKYKTKYKYKFFGKSGKVLQKGKNGKRKITKEVIKNEQGEVLEEKTIKKEIVTKAKPKIVVTKDKKK